MKDQDSKIDRRSFLGGTLGLLALGSLPGLAQSNDAVKLLVEEPADIASMPDLSYLTASAEEITQKIEKAFPFLDLDRAGLESFARDLILFRNSGDLKPIPFLSLEQRFLMSSTFFDSGADESQQVKYVTFYDPYVTPCSNRLAQPAPGSDDREDAPFWG